MTRVIAARLPPTYNPRDRARQQLLMPVAFAVSCPVGTGFVAWFLSNLAPRVPLRLALTRTTEVKQIQKNFEEY